MRKFIVFFVVALVVVATAVPAFATGNTDIVVPLDAYGMTDFSISLAPGHIVVSVLDGSGNVLGSQNVVVGFESVVLNIPIVWNGEAFSFQGGISVVNVYGGLLHSEYSYPPEDFVGSLVISEPVDEIMPLTDELGNVFSGMGVWLASALASLVAIFWTGSSLTIVGVFSVCALAVALVLYVIYLIKSFL